MLTHLVAVEAESRWLCQRRAPRCRASRAVLLGRNASIILTEGKRVAQSNAVASRLQPSYDFGDMTSVEFFKAVLNLFYLFEGAAKWRV